MQKWVIDSGREVGDAFAKEILNWMKERWEEVDVLEELVGFLLLTLLPYP